MNLLILIVRLATWKYQDFLLPSKAVLLNYRVVDMAAIHAAPARRPHFSIPSLIIKEMSPYHEPLAT